MNPKHNHHPGRESMVALLVFLLFVVVLFQALPGGCSKPPMILPVDTHCPRLVLSLMIEKKVGLGDVKRTILKYDALFTQVCQRVRIGKGLLVDISAMFEAALGDIFSKLEAETGVLSLQSYTLQYFRLQVEAYILRDSLCGMNHWPSQNSFPVQSAVDEKVDAKFKDAILSIRELHTLTFDLYLTVIKRLDQFHPNTKRRVCEMSLLDFDVLLSSWDLMSVYLGADVFNDNDLMVKTDLEQIQNARLAVLTRMMVIDNPLSKSHLNNSSIAEALAKNSNPVQFPPFLKEAFNTKISPDDNPKWFIFKRVWMDVEYLLGEYAVSVSECRAGRDRETDLYLFMERPLSVLADIPTNSIKSRLFLSDILDYSTVMIDSIRTSDDYVHVSKKSTNKIGHFDDILAQFMALRNFSNPSALTLIHRKIFSSIRILKRWAPNDTALYSKFFSNN